MKKNYKNILKNINFMRTLICIQGLHTKSFSNWRGTSFCNLQRKGISFLRLEKGLGDTFRLFKVALIVKILVINLFLISILSGCAPKTEVPENNADVKTPVTITAISIEKLSESIELNAFSFFLRKNIIKSTTTGFIENIAINPGEDVQKGQLLFTLKTKEASAINKNVKADSSLAFQGLIKITAPKNGLIASVAHQKGDYVQEGDELATISEVASMIYLLQVPFEMREFIHKNMTCEIILPDKKSIRGTVISNMPVMDIASQTESFVVRPIFQKSNQRTLSLK